MFGYKFIKKKEIENYEKEILSLKGKLKTTQEALDAEIENSNSLLKKFADATREINGLRDEVLELKKQLETKPEDEQKPVEKKTRKRTVKTETQKDETEKQPKQTPRKKRVYKKKTE